MVRKTVNIVNKELKDYYISDPNHIPFDLMQYNMIMIVQKRLKLSKKNAWKFIYDGWKKNILELNIKEKK